MDDRIRQRPMRPAAVPQEVDDEVTGKYAGPELMEHRSRRTTARRLELLESKHDSLASTVSEIRVDVGRVGSKVDTLLEITAAERDARQAREKAEREAKVADMTFAAAQADAKRRSMPGVIKATGVAIAVIVAAALGYYGG